MIEKILQQNTITLARAILALSMLLTLIFTPVDDLFPIYHISKLNESVNGLMKLNYFLWFDNLLIPHIFSIIILLIVILGIYPKALCFLHCWVSYSIFYSMLIVEGGDQIIIILTLFLIPISILDNRKNGWNITNVSIKKSLFHINAKYALLAIKLQMSILYLNAAIAKIYAPEWSNGTAVYYWFNDNMFGAPNWLNDTIGFLFRNDISVSIINWSVIFLELSLFIALFLKIKYKYILFLFAFLFHFSIVLVHGLATFWLAMTGGLILYLVRLDLSISENYQELKKLIIKNINYVKNIHRENKLT